LRQIDVLVTHVHANIEYKTIIECRDFTGKLNVTHVDSFCSKITDVKANKGIIVSRKGFSKTAIRKASRLGIGLCIVDGADTVLKEMALELPMVVVTVEPSMHVNVAVKPTRDTAVHESEWSTINDVLLRNQVIDELENGDTEKLLERLRVHVERRVKMGLARDGFDHVFGYIARVVPMCLKPLLQLGNLARALNLNVEFNVRCQTRFGEIARTDEGLRPNDFKLGMSDVGLSVELIAVVDAAFNLP